MKEFDNRIGFLFLFGQWVEICFYSKPAHPAEAFRAQLDAPKPGTAYPWPPLPVLTTSPRAAHRQPTGVTRVHRAARTPRHMIPVPMLTRPQPVLGEDFTMKKQN
jgi:hypothetical protein